MKKHRPLRKKLNYLINLIDIYSDDDDIVNNFEKLLFYGGIVDNVNINNGIALTGTICPVNYQDFMYTLVLNEKSTRILRTNLCPPYYSNYIAGCNKNYHFTQFFKQELGWDNQGVHNFVEKCIFYFS